MSLKTGFAELRPLAGLAVLQSVGRIRARARSTARQYLPFLQSEEREIKAHTLRESNVELLSNILGVNHHDCHSASFVAKATCLAIGHSDYRGSGLKAYKGARVHVGGCSPFWRNQAFEYGSRVAPATIPSLSAIVVTRRVPLKPPGCHQSPRITL